MMLWMFIFRLKGSVMAEGRRFGFEFKYADAPGRSSQRDRERISRF
jgi:hypothetical protein